MLLGLTGVGSALGADPGAGWEAGFDQPPRQARTRCFWWWLNGNVTKAAITRDLEEMKAKGYGGALIFDADGSSQTGHVRAPAGPTFGTPEWRELFLHALREAKRLDLEMGLSPQSGWNLGGPQVTPAESCKLVTLAVTNVTGPGAVSSPLPQPVARQGFYQDVAVLAYPQPKASGNAKWSASSAQKGREAQVVGDGSVESFWVSDGWNAAAGGESLTLTWPAPVSLGRVEITGRAG
jgi:hypothetical protein